MITAIAAGSQVSPATVITGVVLALAAIISAVTPFVLARRRARRDAMTALTADAENKGALTVASWTALNDALQREINRLQGIVDRQQARMDSFETEIEEQRVQILALKTNGRGPAHA